MQRCFNCGHLWLTRQMSEAEAGGVPVMICSDQESCEARMFKKDRKAAFFAISQIVEQINELNDDLERISTDYEITQEEFNAVLGIEQENNLDFTCSCSEKGCHCGSACSCSEKGCHCGSACSCSEKEDVDETGDDTE